MLRPDLLRQLRQRLGAAAVDALDTLVGLAQAQSLPLFLVGGSVRDLLLGRTSPDLDLVAEGDALALAQALAKAVGARCVVHRQFGTAAVHGEGFAFDLATARAEAYPRPGALPLVRPGTLEQDLARRDLTINALALALASRSQGELLDLYGGLADLSQRVIRVLHDGSFIDDATRILRAILYEARLQFHIEPHTLGLLELDKGYLATVNAARLRLEFQRILKEEAPEAALQRCQELGVLAALHPALSFDDEQAAAFRSARSQTSSPFLLYLALLALRLAPGEAASLSQLLAATNPQRRAVEAAPALLALVRGWEASLLPSLVVQALEPYPEPSLWAVALAAPRSPARVLVRRYLEEWRHVRPALDGRTLHRLGVPPGPKMGRVLERLRWARLDGRVHTRAEEVRAAQEMMDEPSPTA